MAGTDYLQKAEEAFKRWEEDKSVIGFNPGRFVRIMREYYLLAIEELKREVQKRKVEDQTRDDKNIEGWDRT